MGKINKNILKRKMFFIDRGAAIQIYIMVKIF